MSELSGVPKGWRNKKLGEVISLTSGKTKPTDTDAVVIKDRKIPVYGGNGVLGFSASWNVSGENIIIGRVGEYCGVTRYVDTKAWITDNALYTKSVSEDINVPYLAFLLIQSDLAKLRSKGGQPLVSQKPIYDLKISLPPLEEQRKIADILSAWDEAIGQQTHLLELKRERKRGLMQQLLTGKVRFKEFEGLEWERLSLQEVIAGKPRNVNPADHPSEQFDLYSIPAFMEGRKPEVATGSKILSAKQLLERNTVLFGKLNPRILKIWLVNPDQSAKRTIASTEFIALSPDNRVDLTYLYFALHELGFLNQANNLVGGSTGSHQRINPSGFMSLVIPVPPLPEQRKVAKVLSAADAELETLQTQLDALRTQKRGLMQQLLTGKTRVRVQVA